MSDLISRRQAIDAILEYMERLCIHIATPNDTESYSYARGLLVGVINDIKQLPSALGTDLAEVGTDCISRQATIDALEDAEDAFGYLTRDWREVLMELPPAQPIDSQGGKK